MDSYTKRLMVKAEQRSRQLGVGLTPCKETLESEEGESCSSTEYSGAPSPLKQKQLSQTPQITKQSPKNIGGVKPISKNPINRNPTASSNVNKLQIIESVKEESPSKKVLRHYSAFDKENNDLGIEINIMTDTNVAVKVQVEEHKMDEDDSQSSSQDDNKTSADCVSSGSSSPQPASAMIRDVSRNRLQRLGALYSNTNDLSSPIHRTEGHFHASGDDLDSVSLREREKRRNQKGLDKLAALAKSMNEWEDDISHRDISATHMPLGPAPPKPALPSRDRLSKNVTGAKETISSEIPKPAERTSLKGDVVESHTQKEQSDSVRTSSKVEGKEKVVSSNKIETVVKSNISKWDQDVIQSLEAQGFQRRDSSNIGVNTEKGLNSPQKQKTKAMGGSGAGLKSGLVSDRTAIFEHQMQVNNKASPSQKPMKDPVELSLKERMQLFEKNKSDTPLLPKAPFGMPLPANKVQPQQQNPSNKKEQNVNFKVGGNSTTSATSAGVALVSSKAEGKLRDKVAALFSATNDNRSVDDIRRQREEEMQLLGQRFHKNKAIAVLASSGKGEAQKQTMKTPPPPPPPLPSTSYGGNLYAQLNKRRSCNKNEDESKRARKSEKMSSNMIELGRADSSDEESFSDNQECTTATATDLNSADEMARQPFRSQDYNRSAGVDGRRLIGADDFDNNNEMEDTSDEDSKLLDKGILRKTASKYGSAHSTPSKRKQRKSKAVHYGEQHYYILNGHTDEEEEDANNYIDEVLEDCDTSNSSIGNSESRAEELDLDEDYEGQDLNGSNLSDGSQCTAASHSFTFRKSIPGSSSCNKNINKLQSSKKSSNEDMQSSAMQPVTSELTVNKGDDNNLVTLVHTVSFYRRQQNSNNASCSSTPVRRICREDQLFHDGKSNSRLENMENLNPNENCNTEDVEMASSANSSATDSSEENNMENLKRVEEKIEKLLVEVCKQQQIITQTSQALNLCAATVEFSGSTESVEGERHLLVATHRRLACLEEIQRLRIEKTLRPTETPTEKGCLTVKEITVPLRQDYVRKLANDTISGHHLVCLLKYNEHVLATQTVPTLPGLLAVKFPDVLQLDSVYADFKVTLEVYGMTAQREVLPHNIKYHINLGKKGGMVKTPKKKANDNRLIMPPVQSPAGPQAVRTPVLVQYGFALFSLKEMRRTSWTLTQVLGVSPLEGLVHMKVNCELSISVEYRGFLTMFEDISGFGAWHRRWCHLNGTILSYWKYPEDEKKKLPIGSIDLYSCITRKVTLVPRDICARLNTVLLEYERAAEEGDTESLIMIPKGRTTVIRYLLSADTKEEREEWCAYLNKALTLLRAWGTPQ